MIIARPCHRSRTRGLPALCAGLLFSLMAVPILAPAQASDTFTTRPLRIGFVDIDRVTVESPTINKLMDEMETLVSREQNKLEVKRQEYEQLRRELQQKESILSKEALAEKREQMDKLRQEIEDLGYEIDKLVNQSDRRVVKPAMDLIGEAIRRVGREYDYDLILRGEVVLHGSRRTDLTGAVVHTIETIARERQMKP
ncbi:MAG: hypothetical protein Kow0059_14050 [Candidatus Sumerlaeia bacterium]